MTAQNKLKVFLRSFTAAFPPPKILETALAAVDISDTSIKYLNVKYNKVGCVPDAFETIRIPDGVVVSGVVKKPGELTKYLEVLRKKHEDTLVSASLPEELAYLFDISISKGEKGVDIKSSIEFALPNRVPISIEDAIFDYDIVDEDASMYKVSVTVYPKQVVNGYIKALEDAGFSIHGLELEAQAVARSIVARDTKGISMVIDFGRTRTGITITDGQTPIFTTTVHVGGDAITKAIRESKSISEEDADLLKREAGLTHCDDPELHAQIVETVKSLAKEIERHYRFWSSRRDEHGERIQKVERILLCGGATGLRGLPEYISGALNTPVQVVNIWGNLFPVDEYIPSVIRTLSWQYATVVGLILRNIR